MVLVTLSTVQFSFNRLMEWVIEYYKDQPNKKVTIQSGSTIINSHPPNIKIVPFIPFSKITSYYKNAKTIISACGEGSVLEILAHSKNKPIFIPRRVKFKEHVDDQQYMVAKYLQKNNIAYFAKDKYSFFKLLDKQTKTPNNYLKKSYKINKKLIDSLSLIADNL